MLCFDVLQVSCVPGDRGHIYVGPLLAEQVQAEITNAFVWFAECHPSVPPTSNMAWKHLSVLWFSRLPFIYDNFKKPCIVNFLPQMRSNIYGALPTTISITINVNSPLHLSPFYYNDGNVKCICNSRNTVMASRLSNVHYCNDHNSHFTYCFSLHFVNQKSI